MEQISEVDRQRAGSFEPEKHHRVSGDPRSIRGKELQFQRQTSVTGVIRETPKRRNSAWMAKKETSAIQNGRISISKSASANKSSVNRKELSIQRYCYQSSPERHFPAEEAQLLIKTILENRLQSAEYSGDCSAVAKELADKVKKAAKDLLYERYKLICFVAMGQIKDSGISCSSRGVWCPVADTFAEYCFRNDSLYALCVLYAVYQE
ncbi:hypothetical protein SKAU_G00070880 [Synaphobranchus kaupii]|uniref:Tctex1 domain-containing protein 2 n=1 Tax=Synaphobranchus kaupii TaxID=118154 RepID=A0A9Q1G6P8_SYNKA|nr:hypothetical protein SKAU_G00070880 [Synaphobranchus kaupii]